MTSHRAQRGIGLIDALIALGILAFGLLALTRFQGSIVTQTTESQSRGVASLLVSELMSTAAVDPANLDCYTLPATGACTSAAARATTDDWHDKVLAALPGSTTASSTVAGTRLLVRLEWTGKESKEQRALAMETDVQ